ncbi:MAG: hypothetical protein Q8L15_05295 [Methylobacter sp.]|nr:hypothetical protein [Methylobacter sp.]
MKITNYSLAMQSSHSSSQQASAEENIRTWADSSVHAAPSQANSQQVTISAAAQEKQASEAEAIDNAIRDAQNDPKLQLIILMVEKMTGQKVGQLDANQLKATQTTVADDISTLTHRPGFGTYQVKEVSYSESEQTTMQASGVIKTSDDKEIKFSLNLVMQYQYRETSSTSVRLGDAPRKADPLVINFNGTAAQLSEQRFAFDLNSDGNKEQINAPLSGSGFLALDNNNDGKINDGSELFGPATGNGFGELEKYDSDHNGWIDENDAVFTQLKVWTKDSAGNDKLSSLAAHGVGAISLQSIATPFDIKTSTNQLLGTVQSSSVVLNENGTVGSVQHIDMTI